MFNWCGAGLLQRYQTPSMSCGSTTVIWFSVTSVWSAHQLKFACESQIKILELYLSAYVLSITSCSSLCDTFGKGLHCTFMTSLLRSVTCNCLCAFSLGVVAWSSVFISGYKWTQRQHSPTNQWNSSSDLRAADLRTRTSLNQSTQNCFNARKRSQETQRSFLSSPPLSRSVCMDSIDSMPPPSLLPSPPSPHCPL